jgi:malate/lactate dehydrogenase
LSLLSAGPWGSIEREVRYANITIIEGNQASQFGIGMVAARIAEMVLRDERAVIPDRFLPPAVWRHPVPAERGRAAGCAPDPRA